MTDPATSLFPPADPWYVRSRVGDGITLVTEPHVHPLLRCNVWHVQGRDRDLVVDTALGLAPLRPALEAELGRELVAVATHGHSDHVGGLHEFEQRAIHPAEAQMIRSAIQVFLDSSVYPDTVLGPYADAGYEIPAAFVDARPLSDDGGDGADGGQGGAGVWESIRTAPAAPPTMLLDEGDVLDLGDRVFQVLHLPGHSPGSIGLWEEATGVLFSGDAVYDGPLLDQLDGSDVDTYVATMERLRELPVSVVHGGHEPSFDRHRLVELCDAYLRVRAA